MVGDRRPADHTMVVSLTLWIMTTLSRQEYRIELAVARRLRRLGKTYDLPPCAPSGCVRGEPLDGEPAAGRLPAK